MGALLYLYFLYILNTFQGLAFDRFMEAGLFTPSTLQPTGAMTFLNTGRRLFFFQDGFKIKRERIDLNYIYSLEGLSDFFPPDSVLPKDVWQPVQFDFGTAQATGLSLRRIKATRDPIYDGQVVFS